MAKPELRNHRKFRKLRRLLQEPVPHLIGYLDCLWHQGYQTGDPRIGDATDVEAAAEFPGEPGCFTTAALEAGFIEQDADGTYRIHDLYEHAPRYVQLRMKRKGFAPPDPAHTERTMCADSAHADAGGAQTAPPPKPKPRAKAESQEPRTESQEPNPGEAEAGGDGCDTPGLWGDGPIRFDPSEGSWSGITDQQRAVWAKAYPAVDLNADLARAAAWCVANPKEGRKSNYGRFLANWFRRTQDNGGTRVRVPAARSPPDFRDGVVSERDEFLRRTGGPT